MVVVEEPSHEPTGGMQAGYGLARSIQHTTIAVHVYAPERERYPARHRASVKGRGIERQRPVGLRRFYPFCPLSVFDGRIEPPRLHGAVEARHRLLWGLGPYPHLPGELPDFLGFIAVDAGS